MNHHPIFTVFTPTFNRAHTLPSAYDSLCRQTFRDFEWLVVDDGSTDGTGDLIRSWQAENMIVIRYFYQENQGKHIAFNNGVQKANGDLFLTLDSDDSCVPNALECFYQHWLAIPEAQRDFFSGVTCLCCDQEGRIIGIPFPEEVIDSDPITMATQYKMNGDKWGFHRTEILRQFPYPVFIGERFAPEGLVWNRIAKSYKLRFVNNVLRIVEYLPDGLSACSLKIRINNPLGARLYYLEYSQFRLPIYYRLRTIINYLRFSFHSNIRICDAMKELGSIFFGISLLPFGYLLYLNDRRLAR